MEAGATPLRLGLVRQWRPWSGRVGGIGCWCRRRIADPRTWPQLRLFWGRRIARADWCAWPAQVASKTPSRTAKQEVGLERVPRPCGLLFLVPAHHPRRCWPTLHLSLAGTRSYAAGGDGKRGICSRAELIPLTVPTRSPRLLCRLLWLPRGQSYAAPSNGQAGDRRRPPKSPCHRSVITGGCDFHRMRCPSD